METIELINELRAEIAALSLRVDQLEKQLAETQTLTPDFIPATEISEGHESEIPEDSASEIVEGHAEELPEDSDTGMEGLEVIDVAENMPYEEAPSSPVIQEERRAEEPQIALDLDIQIDKQGSSQLPDLRSFQWMTDMPGSEVANMISGISLNDRVLFINTLFREDPGLFQSTITSLNGMRSMEDAVAWLVARFPEWNLTSEVVYRFMMAARRKLR